MFGLKSKIEFLHFKKKWRRLNKHNFTHAIEEQFDISRVSVGNGSYGKLNIKNYGVKTVVKIGNYCSIADNVMILASLEHPTNFISSYPFKAYFMGIDAEMISKGDIIIDDDVWIGYGATILSGVHIGQGAVIAAGAVVSHDVPPYAIVGGVPAKVIKYRFSPELIEELLKVDYSKLKKEDIEKHIDELYIELKDKRQLDWMPKK